MVNIVAFTPSSFSRIPYDATTIPCLITITLFPTTTTISVD